MKYCGPVRCQRVLCVDLASESEHRSLSNADQLVCVIPDLFHGDPVPIERPPGFDVMKWLNGPPGHLPDRVE